MKPAWFDRRVGEHRLTLVCTTAEIAPTASVSTAMVQMAGSTRNGFERDALPALYSVLNTRTFAVVTLVGRTGDGDTDLSVVPWFAKQKPLLGAGVDGVPAAQAGVPLTSASSPIRRDPGRRSRAQLALAIVDMVSAVISAFLYLRIMISVWLTDPEAAMRSASPSPSRCRRRSRSRCALGSPCSSGSSRAG